MKANLLIVLACASGLGGGCATGGMGERGALTYANSPVQQPGGGKGERPFKLDLIAMLDPPASSTRSQNLEQAFAGFEAQAGDKKSRRNSIVGALLMASDRNCDIYIENLRGLQSGWRTSFSVIGTLLSSASTVVTVEDTKNLLSGGSTFSSGVSGKLDENILAGKGMEILTTAIRAGREPMRATIIRSMREQDYASWPVELAIADVMQYHGRCNVVSGLNTAQTAVNETLNTTEVASAPAVAGGPLTTTKVRSVAGVAAPTADLRPSAGR